MAELRTPGRAAFSIPAFRTGKMGRGAPGILLNVFPSAVKAGSSTLACLLWTAMGYTGAKGGPEETSCPQRFEPFCVHRSLHNEKIKQELSTRLF